MLVLRERQVRHDHRGAAAIAQSEAELDVGDPVELEPGVETLQRLRVGAPEGHAVALDRVHVRSGARGELLERSPAAQPVRAGYDNRGILAGLHERRYAAPDEAHARAEQDPHLAAGPAATAL